MNAANATANSVQKARSVQSLLALTSDLRQSILMQDFAARNKALRQRLSEMKSADEARARTLREFGGQVAEMGEMMESVYCGLSCFKLDH